MHFFFSAKSIHLKDKNENLIPTPICPIFDHVHLIKCLRNMLMRLKRALLVRQSPSDCNVVLWDILRVAYELEKKRGGVINALPRINDAHMYESKCPKQKTHYAVQVFSRTMSTYVDMHSGKYTSISWQPILNVIPGLRPAPGPKKHEKHMHFTNNIISRDNQFQEIVWTKSYYNLADSVVNIYPLLTCFQRI